MGMAQSAITETACVATICIPAGIGICMAIAVALLTAIVTVSTMDIFMKTRGGQCLTRQPALPNLPLNS